MTSPRIVVVGHYAYFANHFPEGWATDKNVLCLDVDEKDYSFLIAAANFKPDIALFYRPELYPERYLKMIGGSRVAFLSEPVPELKNGQRFESAETQLRLAVYSRMNWDSFDRVYYYDKSKEAMIGSLGWPITGYRPLPVDTMSFKPGRMARSFDVCFIGKATPHRIQQLDFLRSLGVRFVWIAHGVSGADLASVFRRSKVVLNVHADGLTALEPRVWLAASCGCVVLSERLPPAERMLLDHVIEYDGSLNEQHIFAAIRKYDDTARKKSSIDRDFLSCRTFLREQLQRSWSHSESV